MNKQEKIEKVLQDMNKFDYANALESEKKRKKLRSKIFNIVFRGIEALWMLLQIVQYLLQIFK